MCFFFNRVGLVYTMGHQSVYRLVFRVAGDVLSPSDLVFFAMAYPLSEFYTSQYSGAAMSSVALLQEG